MTKQKKNDRPRTQFEKAGEHLMDRETPRRERSPEEEMNRKPDRQKQGDAEIDRAA